MEIEINLYEDWREIILKEIENLKEKEFVFESFDEWNMKRLKNLQLRKAKLAKDEKTTEDINQHISEADLIEEYKEHLLYMYFNLKVKFVEQRRREVKFPANFSCPPDFLEGYVRLVDKVRKGDDLFPHLSKQIFDPSFLDGMLFDWGIYHFHLGINPDRKNPMLIERTKEVLYAMVTHDTFYVITIGEHGKWADRDLLKIVKKNFPEQIEPYKLKGVIRMSHNVNEKDHLSLRAGAINTFTEVDGEYYGSMGGGINSAGGSGEAVWIVDKHWHWFEDAEEFLKINSARIQEFINKNYGFNEEKLRLELEKFENDRITVVCKEHGFSISLHHNEKSDFQKISLNSMK